MITILIGILSSVASEIVVAFNKKLKGTVLQGDGAFILAFSIAIIGAVFTQITTYGIGALTNWGSLTQTFTGVFTVSQLYFLFITQKLNLDVQPDKKTIGAGTVVKSVIPVQVQNIPLGTTGKLEVHQGASSINKPI